MTSARSEPGTLSYAVYVSEDGQTITFYERYADEAAVLAHQASSASGLRSAPGSRDDLHAHHRPWVTGGGGPEND